MAELVGLAERLVIGLERMLLKFEADIDERPKRGSLLDLVQVFKDSEAERGKVSRAALVELMALREELRGCREALELKEEAKREAAQYVYTGVVEKERPKGPRTLSEDEIQPSELDQAAAQRLLHRKGVRPK